jgi:hypothetical protein
MTKGRTGWWWKDGSNCPLCGAAVLVETECEFRGFAPAPSMDRDGLHLRCRTCAHYVRRGIYGGTKWQGACNKHERPEHANSKACGFWISLIDGVPEDDA